MWIGLKNPQLDSCNGAGSVCQSSGAISKLVTFDDRPVTDVSHIGQGKIATAKKIRWITLSEEQLTNNLSSFIAVFQAFMYLYLAFHRLALSPNDNTYLCLKIKASSPFLWDMPCDYNQPAICTIDCAVPTAPTTTTTTTTTTPAPSKYLGNNISRINLISLTQSMATGLPGLMTPEVAQSHVVEDFCCRQGIVTTPLHSTEGTTAQEQTARMPPATISPALVRHNVV